jgi:hypothetical protein
MSKINSIAFSKYLLTFGLDDGSVFHYSTGGSHSCPKMTLLYPDNLETNENEVNPGYFEVTKDGMKDISVDGTQHIYTKLNGSNYEYCNLGHSAQPACKTIDLNKPWNYGVKFVIDFMSNNEAHMGGGCSLHVTYDNCTETLY